MEELKEYEELETIQNVKIMIKKEENKKEGIVALFDEDGSLIREYKCSDLGSFTTSLGLYYNERENRLIIEDLDKKISIYDFNTKSFVVDRWDIVKTHVGHNRHYSPRSILNEYAENKVFIIKNPQTNFLRIVSTRDGSNSLFEEEFINVDYVYTATKDRLLYPINTMIFSLENDNGKKIMYSSLDGKYSDKEYDDISSTDIPLALLRQGDKKQFACFSHYRYREKNVEWFFSPEYNKVSNKTVDKIFGSDDEIGYIFGINDDGIDVYDYRLDNDGIIHECKLLFKTEKYDNIYPTRISWGSFDSGRDIVFIVEKGGKKGIIYYDYKKVVPILPVEYDDIEVNYNCIITKNGNDTKLWMYIHRKLTEIQGIDYEKVEILSTLPFKAKGMTKTGYEIFTVDEESAQNNVLFTFDYTKIADDSKLLEHNSIVYKDENGKDRIYYIDSNESSEPHDEIQYLGTRYKDYGKIAPIYSTRDGEATGMIFDKEEILSPTYKSVEKHDRHFKFEEQSGTYAIGHIVEDAASKKKDILHPKHRVITWNGFDKVDFCNHLIVATKYDCTIIYDEDMDVLATYPYEVSVYKVEMAPDTTRFEDYQSYEKEGLYEIDGKYYLLHGRTIEEVIMYTKVYKHPEGYIVVNTIDDRRFKKSCDVIEKIPVKERRRILSEMNNRNK